MESRTYRETSKRRKVWSDQSLAKQAIKRRDATPDQVQLNDCDPYIRIEVYRAATGETAVFECIEGTRINNYRVYCNDQFKGVQGISTLLKNIAKALPSFRRME